MVAYLLRLFDVLQLQINQIRRLFSNQPDTRFSYNSVLCGFALIVVCFAVYLQKERNG